MIRITRTDSTHPAFIRLVKELDAHLRIINGEADDFFAQYNKIDQIRHVILVFDGDLPVGCGAIKEYEPGTMEIKRMFVPPQQRGKGYAKAVLAELENWCREMNYHRCILETSIDLPEAVSLYKKCGYSGIPRYGQYETVETSVCFQKNL